MEKHLCYNCFHEMDAYARVCTKCGFSMTEDRTNHPQALSWGTILCGRYIVGRVIGQGGFGITYAALDHQTGEKVAIKEFFPDSMASRSTTGDVIPYSEQYKEDYVYGKKSFLEEAKTLAEFNNTNGIVHVYSYFEENNTAYFAMEFVEGMSLQEYITKSGGSILIEDAKRILFPVMTAMAQVHSKGIIHRDIKPDNIYIKSNGEICIIDFGAARYSMGEKSRSLDVVLTHGFAPREQYSRHGRQGAFTDVYALGATLYYAVTGHKPQDSIDRMDDDVLAFPSSIGARLSKSEEDAIMKALSLDSQDRFQSMSEFKNALESSQTVAAKQENSGDKSQQQSEMELPRTQTLQKSIAGSSQKDAIGKAQDSDRITWSFSKKKIPMIATLAIIILAAVIGISLSRNKSGREEESSAYSIAPGTEESEVVSESTESPKNQSDASPIPTATITGTPEPTATPIPTNTPRPTMIPVSEMKTLYIDQGPMEFFQVPWISANYTNDNKLIYETLVGIDANGDLTTNSGMSEAYEQSLDSLRFTIHLRDGLMWHDGVPVTKDDIVFSIEKSIEDDSILISTIKNTWRCLEGAEEYLQGRIDHISGIDVIDDKTITLKFAQVAPSQVFTFGNFAILPKHLLEGADFSRLQQDPYFKKPVGSGPFMIDEVKMGQYTTYIPNENYWGGIASFKIYQSANDPENESDLVARFRAGMIDYAYVKNYDHMYALKGTAGCTIIPYPTLYTRWLNINQFARYNGDINPLDDVRVRQAIAYAIDRNWIANVFFAGAVNAGDGTLTPPGNSWKSTGLEKYTYDPQKARELLAEANWDSDRVLKIAYYYPDPATADLMAIIQQYLSAVGIKSTSFLLTGDLPVKVNTLPVTGGWTKDDVSGVEWDMIYGALSATTVLNYYERFDEMKSNNAHPVTQEMKNLTAALYGTAIPEKQKEAYAAFEKWQSENMCIIPLYYSPYWIITSDKIAGNIEHWGNPSFMWDWQIQDWTLN